MAKHYVDCWELRRVRPEGVPDCCSSCHEDDEDGYSDLCSVEDPNGGYGEHSGGVCCAVSGYIRTHPLTQEEWDKLVA